MNTVYVLTRCVKQYELSNRPERHRCVLFAGHDDGCQLTQYLAVMVPELEINIGTTIDATMTVRRVEDAVA